MVVRPYLLMVVLFPLAVASGIEPSSKTKSPENFRQPKNDAEFRGWLERMGGTSERLPPGSFESSGTGVMVRLVVIDRPSGSVSRGWHTS